MLNRNKQEKMAEAIHEVKLIKEELREFDLPWYVARLSKSVEILEHENRPLKDKALDGAVKLTARLLDKPLRKN